jgi:mRNA-degrading endonuclease toxin of MazEF toxin-antitoxin module
MTPARGEVWLSDPGMAAKVRPPPIISVAPGRADRALIAIIPQTAGLRGSHYEVAVEAHFLKTGAFLVQNLSTYLSVRAMRKLGRLRGSQFELVFGGRPPWLGRI